MIVSSKIWGSATWVLNILLKYPSCGIPQILCEFFLLPYVAFLKSFFLSSLLVFINFKNVTELSMHLVSLVSGINKGQLVLCIYLTLNQLSLATPASDQQCYIENSASDQKLLQATSNAIYKKYYKRPEMLIIFIYLLSISN